MLVNQIVYKYSVSKFVFNWIVNIFIILLLDDLYIKVVQFVWKKKKVTTDVVLMVSFERLFRINDKSKLAIGIKKKTFSCTAPSTLSPSYPKKNMLKLDTKFSVRSKLPCITN